MKKYRYLNRIREICLLTMRAEKEGRHTVALYACHKIYYSLTIALGTLIADPKYKDEFTELAADLVKLTTLLDGTDEQLEMQRINDELEVTVQNIFDGLENIK